MPLLAKNLGEVRARRPAGGKNSGGLTNLLDFVLHRMKGSSQAGTAEQL
jgi:hypothetical protein